MDAFADLLRGINADASLIGQEILDPPFSVEFADGAPLTLAIPLRGGGWISTDEGDARWLGPGDTAVVRGPHPYRFTDDPNTSATTSPRTLYCANTPTTRVIGPRTCGDTLDGPTALAVAEFRIRGHIGARLLDALPPLLTIACDDEGGHILDFIAGEVVADKPGQQIVLERLLDWLLVCTLRAWFDTEEANAPAWYTAIADSIAGPALRAMHDAPEHAWTVASLAAEADVSRATFAKRFAELLNEPPLTYLTRWRMTVAADLLAEPGASVSSVARRVGYADPFGFSAAYKRVRGRAPSADRPGVSTGLVVA